MTCIVLTKNPSGGGILAITEGEENDQIAQWPDRARATADALDHTLIKAWGGWVVDLDNEEVSPL